MTLRLVRSVISIFPCYTHSRFCSPSSFRSPLPVFTTLLHSPSSLFSSSSSSSSHPSSSSVPCPDTALAVEHPHNLQYIRFKVVRHPSVLQQYHHHQSRLRLGPSPPRSPPPTTTCTTMVTASEAAAPTTSAKGLSDKDAFMTQFDDVVTLLMDDIKTSFDLPAEALTYVRRVITYNVPHGKLNRGLAVYQCYKAFHPTGAVAAEEAYNANLLGWCVELLQAFFLVADDIMDNSHTRRGQPCFFRLEDVGLNAVNDAIIIEMMLYRILRLRFAGHPSYIHLLDLFQDISYTTEMGQMLDLTSQKPGVVDLDRFSEAVLARIYKYKTSHYTFYLPVALGMRLAGVDNEAAYTTAKEICLEMGHYFQAQDDYLDCFGDPEVIGKVGTDIEENTCTWMIVQALKHVSPEQRSLLDKNYGKKEKEHVDVVKQIYRDIDLPQKFAQFEQDSYVTLRKMIDEVDNMPTGAFEFLLGKIHKRDK